MSDMELISSVADEYELSPEQAREILLRAQDQVITPDPTPPEEEEEEEENVTIIFGTPYSNEDGTINDLQLAQLSSATAVMSPEGQAKYDAYLESLGKDTLESLSAAEAQSLIADAQSWPANLWDESLTWQQTETLGRSWPEAAYLMGLAGVAGGITGILAFNPLKTKILAWQETRALARTLKAFAKAGKSFNKEIIAKQLAATAKSTTQISATTIERATAQAAREAAKRGLTVTGERIGATAGERAVGRAGAELGAEIAARQAAARTTQIGTTASARLITQAAEAAAVKAGSEAALAIAKSGGTIAEQAAARAAAAAAARLATNEAAIAGGSFLARALPFAGRLAGVAAGSQLGALASLPVLAATLPFQAAYYYLQPQVESYIGQVGGHGRSGWGGYQEGGAGAFFGGEGRGLNIPGITDPWIRA